MQSVNLTNGSMDRLRNHLSKLLFAAFLLIVEIAAGCSSNVTGTKPVPDTWYGHNVQTIFNQSCGSSGGGCHIHSSAYGVNLSTYKNVVNGYSSEYGRNLVLPGNASGSPLYDKLMSPPAHGNRMPYGRAPLGSAQIDTIRVWINRGAKNS